MSDKKSNNRRTRNWCAVVYPDSAPDNWKSILDNLNIKWACSPLHNLDVDDDGNIKKAHWHIILCYNGNKSYEQVVEDLDPLNCPVPQICRDVRSSVRYFIHKDHPRWGCIQAHNNRKARFIQRYIFFYLWVRYSRVFWPCQLFT